MDKLDIKSLTMALKSTGSAPVEQPAKLAEKEKVADKKSQTLMDIIKEAKDRKDFNTEACVYIDSEIHEVLCHLKARTRLRIGNLISMLAEQWIHEHTDEIIKASKRKSNRYMDPTPI